MRITICASMVFSEKQLEIKKDLEKLGHTVFISRFVNEYVGKSQDEKEKIAVYNKKENDAIREHWDLIRDSDAILVLNISKSNIQNYIGGNTLLEMGFAYVLDKKIFLYNPIPEMDYRSEIEAVKPIILNSDLTKI